MKCNGCCVCIITSVHIACDSSRSPFNTSVIKNIVEEVHEKENVQYSDNGSEVCENCVESDCNDPMASIVAVHRKYEYVRQQWKDEEDEHRKEMQKVTAKRKKIESSVKEGMF